MHYPRTLAAIAAASLLAAFAAQASKGAAYIAQQNEPEMARFSLIGGATYLMPNMNGLDYLNNTLYDDTPTTQIYSLDRDYHFGYFLAAGYMISKQYDVQVSWSQLDTSTSGAASVTGSTDYISSSNQYGYDLNGATLNAHSSETLNFQSFDGTLGQYHDLSNNLSARLFAGVRYAKIENNTLNNYEDIDLPFSFFDQIDSSFSGWGPELGFDANYDVYDWFGIIGRFSAALLIGELETYSNTYDSYDQVQSSIENEGRMVPAIDAKLGLTLNVPFMDMQDRVMLEAGYEVAYYFNVVDQVQNQYGYATASATSMANHNLADVSMMGPYLNLGVKF